MGNQTGVSAVGGGIVQSFKNNRIARNNSDGTPLTAFAGPGGGPQVVIVNSTNTPGRVFVPVPLLSFFAFSPFFLGGFLELIVPCVSQAPKLLKAFRNGKGVPQRAYPPETFEGIERASAAWYRHKLVQEWLPTMPDVVERFSAYFKRWLRCWVRKCLGWRVRANRRTSAAPASRGGRPDRRSR